jgi:Fe2+ or Zn2+ uptake regulation protein
MSYQDTITYQQEIFKIVSDEKVGSLFENENLMQLLIILRKGPMTLDEIEEAFRKAGNEKSNKTIYRYLHTLEEAGLITQAGVRVITDENNKNTTKTLYNRTAKVFFDNVTEALGEKVRRKIKIISILLRSVFEGKKCDEACLTKFLSKTVKEQRQFIQLMVEEHNEEVEKYIRDFDYYEANEILELVGWLAMMKRKDLEDELAECYK